MRSRVYGHGGLRVVVCLGKPLRGSQTVRSVRDIIHGRAKRSRKLRSRFDPGKLMPLEISHSDVLTLCILTGTRCLRTCLEYAQ